MYPAYAIDFSPVRTRRCVLRVVVVSPDPAQRREHGMMVLNRLVDRLLGVVDAGACVPEHGDQCRCYRNKRYDFDCYGNCVLVGTYCT